MTSTVCMHLSIYLPPHSQPADKASSSSYPSSKYAFFSSVINNNIDFNKGKPPAPEVPHHSNQPPNQLIIYHPYNNQQHSKYTSTGRMVEEEYNFHLGTSSSSSSSESIITPDNMICRCCLLISIGKQNEEGGREGGSNQSAVMPSPFEVISKYLPWV